MIKQLRKAIAAPIDRLIGNSVRKPKNAFKINSSSANKHLISCASLYVDNPCVRRSVSVLASAVASIKFKVYKNGKYIAEHFLYDFLNRPNGMDSWSSFIECLITNYMIYGNSYITLVRNGKKVELHNLHSNNMYIVPGDFGVPKAYEYYVDGKKILFDNMDQNLPYVGHLKNVNPIDDWYGLSPLQAVQVSANLHHAITVHNLSMIQNGGRISGIIALKNAVMPLTDAQKDAITSQLVEQYQGPSNAGRIAFVEGGDFSWQPMGTSPKDMDYVAAKTLAAREISEALGVPSILIGGIGLEGESARANFKEILERFNEGTVLPLAQKLYSFLNNWLVAKLDAECYIQMDLDNFLPLHDKRYKLWDKVNDARFLSEKEKRILLGLENIQSEAESNRLPSEGLEISKEDVCQ